MLDKTKGDRPRKTGSYQYKVTVKDVVDSSCRDNETFVLPGYYSKLPAPYTSKDHPTVLGINKD